VEGISAEERQHVQFLLNQRVAKPVQGVVMEKAVIAVVVMWDHAAYIVVNVFIHVLLRSVKVQLVQAALKRLIAVQVVVIMVSVWLARKVMANLVPLMMIALSPVLIGVAGPV
jgi:hypothetical protein